MKPLFAQAKIGPSAGRHMADEGEDERVVRATQVVAEGGPRGSRFLNRGGPR